MKPFQANLGYRVTSQPSYSMSLFSKSINQSSITKARDGKVFKNTPHWFLYQRT